MKHTCAKCKKELDASFFYKDVHKKNGLTSRCKLCIKLSLNKEKRSLYEKEYWDKRRGDKKKIVLKSYYKNKEHHKAKRKEYLATENGYIRHRKYSQNRRARKRNAFVENVCVAELYSEQGGKCYLCGNKFTLPELESDHVIPLSKGGKHEKKNVKLACVFCNRSKGAKLLGEVSYQMV